MVVTHSTMTDATSYDALCAEAASAAESRLLDHFKLHGGEVWTIGTGCEKCRHPVEDVNALKKCSVCQAALFCNATCLKEAWRRHKGECAVIAALRKHDGRATDQARNVLLSLLKTLGWLDEVKSCSEPKIVGVATSLQMSETSLPGWFCTVDYETETKERRKQLDDVALTLYALLRDDESWTRDKDSFPRSSYTHVESIPHANASQPTFEGQLLQLHGHLLLLSLWLQHPEPPATQSIPLEDRGFYGVIDSILQISAVRDAIDRFMDAR